MKSLEVKSKTSLTLAAILFFLIGVSIAFPGMGSVRALFYIAFFGVMVLATIFGSKKMPIIYMLALSAFYAFAYVSRKWAIYPIAVNEMITNTLWAMMLNVSMAFFIVYENHDPEDIGKKLLPVAAMLVANVILTGGLSDKGRLSIGTNENQIGITAAYMYLFVLYMCKKKGWNSLVYDTIAIALFVVVALSGSRTALLDIVSFTVAVLMFEKYDINIFKLVWKIIRIVILLAMILFILMKVDIFYNTVGNRLETLFTFVTEGDTADSSAVTRDFMKEEAIKIFAKNPVIGVGLNNFKYVSRFETYSHTTYYELLSCLGIIGFALYYIPIFSLLLISFINWKKGKENAIVPFVLIAAFLVNDFGTVSYFSYNEHIFLGLAVGMALLERRKCINEKEEGCNEQVEFNN